MLRSAAISILASIVACSPARKAQKTVSEADADAARRACAYGAGALAQSTLASDAPTGSAIPIDHVVFVMQENHSFDSIFSELGGGAQGAPAGVTNPNGTGSTVARVHQDHFCTDDPAHDWTDSHTEWDNGANDGFVKASGAYSLNYWDETDLPFYYALARAFTVSDSHFCALLGPTMPNRMFSLAGTSFGLTFNNIAPATDSAGKPYPNLFTELDAAKVSWKYYVDSSPPEGAVFVQTYVDDASHFLHVSDFMADAAAGRLPSFSIVEGHTTSYGDNQDEHPPGDIQIGQQFTASVVKALTTSPNWPKSALFFTYDEHGGFYDSVPPPSACPPDQIPESPPDAGWAFDRYGFRVPLIVVSPYAKRGYVTHHVTDHTSILRFVEARFGLPAMTARDANADPLYDAFDFQHPDTSIPALPEATLDAAGLAYCNATYPDPSN